MARTLDELAALSGVSRATVSRVLNGGPVAAHTRQRVLAVLEQTSYRPNLAARSLASGRSGVVGVVMHVDPATFFQDPYFSRLLQGMSDGLADHAAGMMLWLGSRTKEDTLDGILGMGLLDGVIATVSRRADPLIDGLMTSDMPTVLVGHRSEDTQASYVDVDNVGAASAVTRYLIDLGYRRIAHVTGTPGTVAGDERLDGYRRAVGAAGLSDPDLVQEGDFTYEGGWTGTGRLLEIGADAIFCGNDASAAGALARLRAEGIRVPEQVAVVGFDDLDLAARQDPPLTTVRQEIRQQGVQAAEILFQLLRNPLGSPRQVILPTELVIRASTAGGEAREGSRSGLTSAAKSHPGAR